MGRTAGRVLAAAIGIAGVTTAVADPGNTTWQHNYAISVSQDGGAQVYTRYYKIYIPASYYTKYSNTNPVGKAPVVLVFHGASFNYTTPFDTTAQASVWSTQANSLADQGGFLVVAPNGFSPTSGDGDFAGSGTFDNLAFNDCTGDFTGYNSNSPSNPVDDVAFIRNLLTDLPRELDQNGKPLQIDTTRIYATGVSNGATMALRLARELPPGTLAAAAAALAGDGALEGSSPLALRDQCANFNLQSSPVPIWLIKGTLDQYAVFTGGASIARNALGTYDSWMPYEPGWTGNSSNSKDCASPANASTSPAGFSTIAQMRTRYQLSSTPASTLTYSGSTGMLCKNPAGKSITVRSTVSCSRYVRTGNARSEIDDCLAIYNGHIEPSNIVIAPLTVQALMGNQTQVIDTATEEWKFFKNFHN